jgi:hypothetical protein
VTSEQRFREYCDRANARLSESLGDPDFANLVSVVDCAYLAARNAPDVSAMNASFGLLCHQALFNAALLIGCGLGLEAASVSRRALEVAKIALAVKLDPSNLEAWQAFEERTGRWANRRQGIRPRSFTPNLAALAQNRSIQSIGNFIGIISDAAVHFTPEMLSRMKFKAASEAGTIYLSYLEPDHVAVARDLAMLGAVHKLILSTLSESCDSSFERVEGYLQAMRRISEVGIGIHRKYGFEMPTNGPESATSAEPKEE